MQVVLRSATRPSTQISITISKHVISLFFGNPGLINGRIGPGPGGNRRPGDSLASWPKNFSKRLSEGRAKVNQRMVVPICITLSPQMSPQRSVFWAEFELGGLYGPASCSGSKPSAVPSICTPSRPNPRSSDPLLDLLKFDLDLQISILKSQT